MAINTASKTYTPAGGAGTALQNTTAKNYTSTVGGKPVAQASQTDVVGQQVTSQTPPEASVAPPMVQGPVNPDSLTPTDTGADIDQLANIRTQMVDELFRHDNNLKQQFTNQNIENPLLREQLAGQPVQSQMGLLSSLNNLISMRKNELKASTAGMPPAPAARTRISDARPDRWRRSRPRPSMERRCGRRCRTPRAVRCTMPGSASSTSMVSRFRDCSPRANWAARSGTCTCPAATSPSVS